MNAARRVKLGMVASAVVTALTLSGCLSEGGGSGEEGDKDPIVDRRLAAAHR